MLGIVDNKKYYEQIDKMYERIANSEDTAFYSGEYNSDDILYQ